MQLRGINVTNIAKNESQFVVERLIRACAITGLIGISLEAYLVFLERCAADRVKHDDESNYFPSSMCYVPLLQTLRRLGKLSKMEQVISSYDKQYKELQQQLGSQKRNLLAPLNVVAFNVYLAALCEDVSTQFPYNQGANALQFTNATAWRERIDKAINLVRPGISSISCGGVQPDLYSYNTVLHAVSQLQIWNKSVLMDEIQQWMKPSLDSSPISTKGNIVTTNALLRGYVESGDFSKAVQLFDNMVMVADSKTRNCNSPEDQPIYHFKGDRFTVDFAITPLLFFNRTDDVLRLIEVFAKSPEATSLDNKKLSDIFAAFLTRIALHNRSPHVAGKILRSMFLNFNKDNKEISSIRLIPSTRHCNIVIHGYRKLQQQSFAAQPWSPLLTPSLRNQRSAGHIWRSMIRFNLPPDKYTVTSMLGLQTQSQDIKDIWKYAATYRRKGSNETVVGTSEIVCRSLITELGRVGDASSACSVFDWMWFCHNRLGRSLPRHKDETWNTLLAALAAREGLNSEIIQEKLSEDMSTWLWAPPGGIIPYTNIPNGTLLISQTLKGMTRIKAVKKVFEIMQMQNQTALAEQIPKPNSQTFCIVAAALARWSDTVTNNDISTVAEAMDLFRVAIKSNIQADGRFVNAILRCFGSDIDSAMNAWKSEIGPAVRACKDGNLRNNLLASYHGLMTVCGRARRPNLAIRLAYAMNREGLEPNETTFSCYKAGKRMSPDEPNGNLFNNAMARQFERILSVECSKFDVRDKRRLGDRRLKIIY